MPEASRTTEEHASLPFPTLSSLFRTPALSLSVISVFYLAPLFFRSFRSLCAASSYHSPLHLLAFFHSLTLCKLLPSVLERCREGKENVCGNDPICHSLIGW